MLFAQTCDSTFEVGLSKTMSVPSKYIPFFLIYANIFNFFVDFFIFLSFLSKSNAHRTLLSLIP